MTTPLRHQEAAGAAYTPKQPPRLLPELAPLSPSLSPGAVTSFLQPLRTKTLNSSLTHFSSPPDIPSTAVSRHPQHPTPSLGQHLHQPSLATVTGAHVPPWPPKRSPPVVIALLSVCAQHNPALSCHRDYLPLESDHVTHHLTPPRASYLPPCESQSHSSGLMGTSASVLGSPTAGLLAAPLFSHSTSCSPLCCSLSEQRHVPVPGPSPLLCPLAEMPFPQICDCSPFSFFTQVSLSQ